MLSFEEPAGAKPDEFIAPGFTVNYDTSLNWLKMLFTDSSIVYSNTREGGRERERETCIIEYNTVRNRGNDKL